MVTPGSLSLIRQKAPEVLDTLTQIGHRRLGRFRGNLPGNCLAVKTLRHGGLHLDPPHPGNVRELIAGDHHTVILGEAGAGKTTVLRRLMSDAANQAEHLLTSSRLHGAANFSKVEHARPGKTMESLILDLFNSYEIYEFETEADISSLLSGENSG